MSVSAIVKVFENFKLHMIKMNSNSGGGIEGMAQQAREDVFKVGDLSGSTHLLCYV